MITRLAAFLSTTTRRRTDDVKAKGRDVAIARLFCRFVSMDIRYFVNARDQIMSPVCISRVLMLEDKITAIPSI